MEGSRSSRAFERESRDWSGRVLGNDFAHELIQGTRGTRWNGMKARYR